MVPFFVLLIAASPDPTSYMFCASTGPTPGTNDAYITNIFTTIRPAEDVVTDFQRYRTTFVCQMDRSRSVLQERFNRVLYEFDTHGYNIVQLQRSK